MRDGSVSENIYSKFTVYVIWEPSQEAFYETVPWRAVETVGGTVSTVACLPYCMKVKTCFFVKT